MCAACRPSSGHRPDPRKGLSPIIIVPKGYETKLNMFNAQVSVLSFLAHTSDSSACCFVQRHLICSCTCHAMRLPSSPLLDHAHGRCDACCCLRQIFLEEGRFTTWQECQEAGIKKASTRTFQRTINRAKPVTYHVTDTAPAPLDQAWRRVVAVFVQGKEWQFRDWPFPVRPPPVVLAGCCGCHPTLPNFW